MSTKKGKSAEEVRDGASLWYQKAAAQIRLLNPDGKRLADIRAEHLAL